MPLARSLSVTSLSGLEEWDEEFELEDAVLFEIAWEVANKGKCVFTCVFLDFSSVHILQVCEEKLEEQVCCLKKYVTH